MNFILRESNIAVSYTHLEMDNDSEAQAAIDQLDGAEIDGRAVRVNEARPREDRK